MAHLVNFIIGVFSGLVAGFILMIWVFWQYRPKIIISPYIVKSKNINGETEYKIKLINKSKFTANDVKVELWKKTEYNATSNSNGKNVDITKVQLSTSEWLTIAPYCPSKKIKTTNLCSSLYNSKDIK